MTLENQSAAFNDQPDTGDEQRSVSVYVYPCGNCGDVLRIEPNSRFKEALKRLHLVTCDCGNPIPTGYTTYGWNETATP